MSVTINGSGTITYSTGTLGFGDENLTTTGNLTGTLTGDLPAISGANLTALNASNLASGTVPAARLPSTGKVLQVVSTALDTTLSISSSSTSAFADLTGLFATITPAATSSKILIFGHTVVASSVRATIHTAIFRGSTKLGAANVSNRVGGTTATLPTNYGIYALEAHTVPFTYLDSPSSTSALTYQIKGTLGSSYAGTLYVNRTLNDTDADYGARSRSSITLIEVGA